MREDVHTEDIVQGDMVQRLECPGLGDDLGGLGGRAEHPAGELAEVGGRVRKVRRAAGGFGAKLRHFRVGCLGEKESEETSEEEEEKTTERADGGGMQAFKLVHGLVPVPASS